MHQQGILKTDDLITRFFRLCTEMCVDLCYRALSEQSHSPTLVRAKCFHTLDAFVRLIALLVKHSGDATNSVTKINLLNKVCNVRNSLLILHLHTMCIFTLSHYLYKACKCYVLISSNDCTSYAFSGFRQFNQLFSNISQKIFFLENRSNLCNFYQDSETVHLENP